jgi:uncharacterized protein YxeA
MKKKYLFLILCVVVLVLGSYYAYKQVTLSNLESSWYKEYQQLDKDSELMKKMTYSGEVISVFGDKVTVEISHASDKSLIGKKHSFYLNDHSHVQYGPSPSDREVIKKGAEVNVLAYKDMIAMIHIKAELP